MFSPSKKYGFLNQAVLAISDLDAEWFEIDASGKPMYGRAVAGSFSAHDLALAAATARERAGGTATRCRLTLGSRLVEHKLFSLPELSRGELKRVLERRTKGARSDPDKPFFFSATDCGGLVDGIRNWLSVSVEREFITHLLVDLRKRKIRTRSVTVGALAALNHAADFVAEDGQASIAITIDKDSIEVCLIAEGVLVSSESLSGSFEQSTHLVSSLLQTLRSVAGFWRKSHGGAEVSSVHVFGMAAERSSFLEQAIQGALREAEVICEAGPECSAGDSSRISTLAACLRSHSLAPEFSIPLPQTRAVEGLVLGLCTGTLLLGFAIVKRAVKGPQEELMEEITRLDDDSSGLPLLQRAEEETQGVLAAIDSRMNQASLVQRDGLDYRSTMVRLLGAFEAKAAVLSISIGPRTAGFREVGLSATTDVGPVESLMTIQAIEQELQTMTGVSTIRVNVPTILVDEDGEDLQALNFSIDLTLEETS
jgi:hypothetical protein